MKHIIFLIGMMFSLHVVHAQNTGINEKTGLNATFFVDGTLAVRESADRPAPDAGTVLTYENSAYGQLQKTSAIDILYSSGLFVRGGSVGVSGEPNRTYQNVYIGRTAARLDFSIRTSYSSCTFSLLYTVGGGIKVLGTPTVELAVVAANRFTLTIADSVPRVFTFNIGNPNASGMSSVTYTSPSGTSGVYARGIIRSIPVID